MKFIIDCDFLSRKAYLTFNDSGDKRFKTNLGGILSIFSILISIIFIIIFFQRLIRKQDASIIISTERNNKINITYSNNFPFMFRISDAFSMPLTSYNLYNISLLIWYGYIEKETNKLIQKYDNITVEKCDLNKHFGEYKKYFNQVPDIETYFCPKQRLYNQTLYGIYGDHNYFRYYNFYFSKCINSTNNTCLEINKINNILSDAYLDLKYMSYTINSTKSRNINNLIVISDRYIVSSTIYKRLWLHFNQIKYSIDNGLFFPFYENEIFHQFDHLRIDVDLRDMNLNIVPQTFMVVTILNSGNILLYKKIYLKIQDYLATIGGIIKTITIICQCLNYFNALNSYYCKLINDFLIENNIKNNKKYIIENNFLDKSDGILFKSHSMKCISKPQINRNNYQLSKSFATLKKKKMFNYKYRNMFLPISFKLINHNDKVEFKKYIHIINQKLNIINILNELEQSQQLKKFVYNTLENQFENIDSNVFNNNQEDLCTKNNFINSKDINKVKHLENNLKKI